MSICLLIGFIAFILFYVSEGNVLIIGLTVLTYCFILFPRAYGKQYWALEQEKFLFEESPKTFQTYIFFVVMSIRWIYVLGLIIVPVFTILGIIKFIFMKN